MITSMRSFKQGALLGVGAEGGGGGGISRGTLRYSYEFVWIIYPKIGVGGSTADKSQWST